MADLPKAFVERMRKQLPVEEQAAFFAVYDKEPYRGVRLNPLKGDAAELRAVLPSLGERIPWEENGFYRDGERLGASPYHAAGLFYSQEPSAMCAAPLLAVRPGERVLDLCAAPGGKSTQIACAMQGEGLIVVNEPIAARAKILSQNIERMGIKNAAVVSELPETLAKKFVGYFDKILIDAPCSGEGMFRKNAEEALAEWSEENVALCAKRQRCILNEGTKMLRVGGRLVYSTCTFSEEEDEGQVCDYLASHPEMRLLRQEKLYPHRVRGEGHFAALFEKTERAEMWESRIKPQKSWCSREAERAYRDFEKSFFKTRFAERLYEANGMLYELPEDMFDWKDLSVLRVGVRLGEARNGRFEPSHSLALAVKKSQLRNVADFEAEDERLKKYLRGETFSCDGVENGWCVVCVHGYPVGLGKAVNGTVKNHYPKGLRLH